MAAVQLRWEGDEVAPFPALTSVSTAHATARAAIAAGELPASVAAALWRGTELGAHQNAVVASGFAALDAELPGGGWPCHALTELLQPQTAVAEWRLLAPTLRAVAGRGLDVVVVGPPRHPHLPGLRLVGLDERRLVWIQAEAPSERLWVTEQVVRANAAGLLISWLPQARPEQIRRLQICAQACEGPVFLCRPLAAQHEPSAAPLRVELRFGLDWELHLRIVKRKGPTHEGVLALPSIPGGLESILTPRLRAPSALLAHRKGPDVREVQRLPDAAPAPLPDEVPHVVGSPAPRRPALQRLGTH